MDGNTFALVEDGTKRAIYFRGNKQYAICTLGGVWKRSFESVAVNAGVKTSHAAAQKSTS